MRTAKGVVLLIAGGLLVLSACGKQDGPTHAAEICNNQVDDDGNGKIDCADPACASDAACQGPQCSEGETACGSTCCAAGQVCTDGVCQDPGPCAAGETECGSDCCTADETCESEVCIGQTPNACTAASTYGTVDASGRVEISDGMVLKSELPSVDGTPNYLYLGLFDGKGAFAGGVAPGSYEIAGDDLNADTCGLCVMLLGNATLNTVGQYYMATGGGVEIDRIDGALEAKLTSGTFQQVTIDPQTGASVPVDAGCTSSVDEVDFHGTMPVGCNPLADECGDGEGCYWNGTHFICSTAGTVPEGQACRGGICVPGSQCMSDGLCHAWCDPAATENTCSSGLGCVALDNGLGTCMVVEDCTTPGDEDHNGLADCLDPACAAKPVCLDPACQAATVETGSSFSGRIEDGSQSSESVGCDRVSYGNERVYTLSAGQEGEVGQLTVTVDASGFHPIVYARSACADPGTELACNDSLSADGTESLVIDHYQGGTPISLFVDSDAPQGTAGTYDVTVSYVVPKCGNGVLEPYETCDDGNTVASDGCSSTCQVEPGYGCSTPGEACHPIVCGDGIVDAGETCDDGNTQDGDGCSSTCRMQSTETEPNGDMASADPYSDPYNGEITAGDKDWVAITLTGLSSLTVEVQDQGDGACAAGNLASDIEILDATGTVLAGNSMIGGFPTNWCSLDTIGRLGAGTYYVRIQGRERSTTFKYHLAVTIGSPDACTNQAGYGTVVPVTQSAVYDLGMGGSGDFVSGAFELDADPDEVDIELHPGRGAMAGGYTTGTFTLSGADLDYETCGLCVILYDENWDGYMATGGTVDLTSVDGNLAGTLSNMTFRRLVNDGATPAPFGCESTLESMSFDTPIVR